MPRRSPKQSPGRKTIVSDPRVAGRAYPGFASSRENAENENLKNQIGHMQQEIRALRNTLDGMKGLKESLESCNEQIAFLQSLLNPPSYDESM